ncbi:MAG: malate dehydrogenase [Desulfovibrio sp.]|jgi:malate dehydrogenase|nr:malate dehydrogenase [Desulfovibrio sp.]
MPNKISIIGAGNVGATAAQCCLFKNLGSVVLLDTVENIAKGKALDLSQAAALHKHRFPVKGTADYADTAGSNVVIITAGRTRRPGMTRNDLLKSNASIIHDVTRAVVEHSPEATLIIVTNPLDAMCYVAWKVSGLPHHRVVGMSGLLDSSRLRHYIAEAIGAAPHTVEGLVLGEHGDSMAVLTRLATVGGVPVTKLLGPEKLAEIRYRTAHGGGEVVDLLGYSAYYAPGIAIAEMTGAILDGSHATYPCSVYLTGQYGVNGIYMCVPARLGAEGVEDVIELELTDNERNQVATTARNIRELLALLPKDISLA